MLYNVAAVKDMTYEKDCKFERNTEPDCTYILKLDRKKITKWWNQYKEDEKNRWDTVNSNCSPIVYKALSQSLSNVDIYLFHMFYSFPIHPWNPWRIETLSIFLGCFFFGYLVLLFY
jgi:hypothetical protein